MAHGSLCLVNVYLPARGLAMNEILFEECLYELHEIFIKYSPTHTFVLVVISTPPYIEETICVETCYSKNL